MVSTLQLYMWCLSLLISYQVGAQVSVKANSPTFSNSTEHGHLSLEIDGFHNVKNWMTFKEPIGAWSENSFASKDILEHLNVTKDTSDYLWYITR